MNTFASKSVVFAFIRAAAIAVLSTSALAQPEPQLDTEADFFTRFYADTSYLEGTFEGVMEECTGQLRKGLMERSRSTWKKNNGIYHQFLDRAIAEFVARRVPTERQPDAIKTITLAATDIRQSLRKSNKLREKIRTADIKSRSCAKYLGALNSKSFQLQRVRPEAYRYWLEYLQ